MNKKERLNLLVKDAAQNMGCMPDDFKKYGNVFLYSEKEFMMKSFGNNIIMRGNENIINWCKDNFNDETAEEIMDGDNLYKIENKLREQNQKLSGQHVCYLYIQNKTANKPTGFEYKLFERDQLNTLYKYKQYNNALCFNDKIDAIAYGAFYKDKCIALAAADDRNKDIFQIGIDTSKDYRKKGLGAYLVNELAKIITERNKATIYTTWGANIASSNIAIKTGFAPVMVYYYVEEQKKKNVL